MLFQSSYILNRSNDVNAALIALGSEAALAAALQEIEKFTEKVCENSIRSATIFPYLLFD